MNTMSAELLQQAAELAKRQAHVWLATVDAAGRPHLTTAGRLELAGDQRVLLREWFCPATVANAQASSAASVVIWPGGRAEGFQLVGRIEAVRDNKILDGYDPALAGLPPQPQVQREMTIRIDQVLRFRHGPHSDQPEAPPR